LLLALLVPPLLVVLNFILGFYRKFQLLFSTGNLGKELLALLYQNSYADARYRAMIYLPFSLKPFLSSAITHFIVFGYKFLRERRTSATQACRSYGSGMKRLLSMAIFSTIVASLLPQDKKRVF
jgi:hypothetical protein